MSDQEKQHRERMVAEQIRARGVRDNRVLDARNKVHREAFVPENVVQIDLNYNFRTIKSANLAR
jgi:protein-L-isoaspartate O-methyltransferase